MTKNAASGKAWKGQMFQLLELFNCGANKKFYDIGPGAQCYKTFYVRNLRMFVISYNVCQLQDFPA